MKLTKVLFSFKGRINRKEYWLKGLLPSTLISFAALIAPIILIDIALASRISESLLDVVKGALSIPSLIFAYLTLLAIMTKRWHDFGRPAWYNLLFATPLGAVLIILLGTLPGRTETNKYGASPNLHYSKKWPLS